MFMLDADDIERTENINVTRITLQFVYVVHTRARLGYLANEKRIYINRAEPLHNTNNKMDGT